jgi:hypothetical protein
MRSRGSKKKRGEMEGAVYIVYELYDTVTTLL